ncbi:MAG: hypothetical protein CMJ58_01280 [Planctomycetaceae bacterium]|nr:hypothetical protein [Planctomycetaceae bacterium]
MKSFVEQVAVLAVVVAAALFSRVAFADAPSDRTSPRGNHLAYTDEELQEALDRDEGARFRGFAPPPNGVRLQDRVGPSPALPSNALDGDASADHFQQMIEQLNAATPDGLSPDELRELLRIRAAVAPPRSPQPVDRPATLGEHIEPATPPQPQLFPGQPDLAAQPTWVQAYAAPVRPPEMASGPPRPDSGPHTREHRCIVSLRGTATQLDNAANQLEQCELYDQADMLRETAQRLRIDARRLAGHEHEADQDHPLPFGFTDPPAPHFDHPWSQPQGGDSLDPGPGPGGQPAVPELRAQPLEQLSDGSQPPSAGQNNDPPAASSDPPRGDGEPTGDRIR